MHDKKITWNVFNLIVYFFCQIDYEVSAELTISKLNGKMKGKVLGAGDLKQATTNVLPRLVSKMKKETKDMSKQLKKEKVQSFTKVRNKGKDWSSGLGVCR